MIYLHNLVKAFKLNLSFFISRRLAFNREASFSRFVIRLSIIATAFSVAAMILSLSFVNGFQKVISEKVYSFWGHIRVQQIEPYRVSIAEESLIPKNDSIEHAVKQQSQVSFIQSFASKSAILKTNETLEGVLFKGVEKGYHFEHIESFRLNGKWPNLKDSGYSSEVMISDHLSKQLNRKTGDAILVYFIQSGDERPKIRKLHISGVFRTGIDVYDKSFIIGDLQLLRQANNWANNLIGGYEIILKNNLDLMDVSEEIYERLPSGLTSRTMPELYPEIFDWLELQSTNKYILLSVMSIVAIINLITCLLIMVLERTRMVGLLKALGSSHGMIQRIFIIQASFITATGISIGLLIGLGLSYLQLKTGFITLDEEAYYMSIAPVEIIGWQVALVCIASFLISLLMLIIPSLISRKIDPVKAIQFN